MSKSIHHHTLGELITGLGNKQFSSVELTTDFINRIQKLDQKINSFITLTPELALEQAKQADKQRASNTNLPPLLGLPIAHKDIFCTQGVKTTCGSKMLDNFISPYDATVVKNLKTAGVICLGKTNMDEFAMGSSNETSFYGAVKNPWALEAVPGGSSGGSAAAIAARFVPGATGTDTGGSIRQPAALCGITGLKPTYGLVSRYGMIAFASSLDQAGPMAQTAEDCALLLQNMSGFDLMDSTSIDRPVPNYLAHLNTPITGKTFGLPKEYFEGNLPSNMAACIDEAIKIFKKLGVQFTDVALPHTKYAVPVYYVVAPAECSSNLSRYDGVRFGYRCEKPKNLEDLYKRSRGEGFGSEVKRRIMVGTYALSSGYYDAYYIKSQQLRQLIAQDFKKAFESVDLILCPTTPTPAFNIGEKTADPISMYLSDIYTIAVNLAGIPALSMPAGFINDRPVGVQLIGNHFDETLLLNAAHQFQQNTNWHTKMPVI